MSQHGFTAHIRFTVTGQNRDHAADYLWDLLGVGIEAMEAHAVADDVVIGLATYTDGPAPNAPEPTGNPGFVISGGTGHYVIHAVDPRYNARPVIRAYGAAILPDYTSFTEAAHDRDVLNRMWHAHGAENAGIQTAGQDAAPTVRSDADAAVTDSPARGA
jgi:hypothetical protein